MKYGRLHNGNWEISPKRFVYNGIVYNNPKARHYLKCGFLPVVEAAQPDPMYDEYGDPLYVVAYTYGTGEQEGYVIQSYIPIEE